MKNILLICFDNIAPNMVKRVRGKPCEWLSADLKRHMNIRDQMLRISRNTKSLPDINAYKKKRNEVNLAIRNAKRTYYKDILNETANDPDSFWNKIKKLYPSKSSKSSPPVFSIDSKNTSVGSALILPTLCHN